MGTSWWAAAACIAAVGTMGFAIQRGGTCCVAAMEELLSQGRARRWAAMLEASLWVAGGLALAQLAQVAFSVPAANAITAGTVIGGVILGLGAWLNGACVFGAIARLGSGQWAQAITPVGFFFGALAATTGMTTLVVPQAVPTSSAPPPWSAPGWLAPAFLLFAVWRVGAGWLVPWRGGPGLATRLAARMWSPHAATVAIGVCFVITYLLAGSWAYTDVLADFAQGASRGGWPGLALPVILMLALYAGALFGGWRAGRWRHEVPTPSALLSAWGGGVLMGAGSVLIPGSNDGLLFLGMPLLMPHAWLAMANMCLAIAAALVLKKLPWRRASVHVRREDR